MKKRKISQKIDSTKNYFKLKNFWLAKKTITKKSFMKKKL